MLTKTFQAVPIHTDHGYANYMRLAQKLMLDNNVTITLANTSQRLPGTGIFTGKNLRQRISFTPYIFNHCSAACAFCSERLLRGQAMPSHLHICENYADKLLRILDNLRGVDIFLSISGMEPLESLPFLERVLMVFADYENKKGSLTEKVLYSNLSKAASDPDAVLRLLKQYPISRLESSRHHYDTAINNSIMHFKPGQPVASTASYQQAVLTLQKHIPVKLACVLQKRGIATVSDVERYISWAADMGIKNISFRELALFSDQVTGGSSYSYILENRQSIYPLINMLPPAFVLQSIVRGYYYFSFKYRYANAVDVTFGVSDYSQMARCHESTEINKLIYYPDGSLCTDWNMLGRIY